MSERLRLTPAAMVALASGDLENFLAAATPGGIEAQEAKGQREMVAASVLPLKSPWDVLESWGVKRGADADDLFAHVVLPSGWCVDKTDHSMWSVLRDADGANRLDIFYKAAFYDRCAFSREVPRG